MTFSAGGLYHRACLDNSAQGSTQEGFTLDKTSSPLPLTVQTVIQLGSHDLVVQGCGGGRVVENLSTVHGTF